MLLAIARTVPSSQGSRGVTKYNTHPRNTNAQVLIVTQLCALKAWRGASAPHKAGPNGSGSSDAAKSMIRKAADRGCSDIITHGVRQEQVVPETCGDRACCVRGKAAHSGTTWTTEQTQPRLALSDPLAPWVRPEVVQSCTSWKGDRWAAGSGGAGVRS